MSLDSQSGLSANQTPGLPEFSNETDISKLFSNLAVSLDEHHGINRGVVLICNEDVNFLGVISVWDQLGLKSGLTLRLPLEKSLFHRIITEGNEPYLDSISSFDGNFFERKLLCDDSTLSFALIPVIHEERTVGMLGFSSPRAEIHPALIEDIRRISPSLALAIDAGGF